MEPSQPNSAASWLTPKRGSDVFLPNSGTATNRGNDWYGGLPTGRSASVTQHVDWRGETAPLIK